MLGLVTTKHLKKYGVEPLLNAFMQDLAQLEQVSVYVETRSWKFALSLFYFPWVSSQQVNNILQHNKKLLLIALILVL